MPLLRRSSDYTLVLTESGNRWTGEEPPFVVHFCLRQSRSTSVGASTRARDMRVVGEYYFEFEGMDMFWGSCRSGRIAVRDMLSVLEFGEATGPSYWLDEFSSALDEAVSFAHSRRLCFLYAYIAHFDIEVFPSAQELAARGEEEGLEEEWLVVRGSLRELGLGLELEHHEDDNGRCLEVITDFYDDDMGRAMGVTTCAICLEDLSENEALSRLRCSHVFHSCCLARWLRSTCPMCRYEFVNEKLRGTKQAREGSSLDGLERIERPTITPSCRKCPPRSMLMRVL